MQTFLPYESFVLSAKCLDYRRLGKQRVEAYQILNILLSRTKSRIAWINHPCVLMWKGYENALKEYYNVILDEWCSRGYKNNMLHEVIANPIIYPSSWLGLKEFHDSHKSNLLRKDYEYYSRFNWNVTNDLPYYWGK